jgi:NTE family protein
MANLVRKSYFWGITATKPAFISEAEYEDFIYPLIPDITIEETAIPFACVATDIRHGKRVLFREGSLRKAISASCALPGIFPPVRQDDMVLVDGGWVERVPVRCACDLSADIIIAVDVSGELGEFEEKSGLDIIMRADAVTRVYLNELLIKRADCVIHPDVGLIHWADFSKPLALISEGELAAKRSMAEIKNLLSREVSPQEKFVKQLKVLRNKIFRAVGE